MVFSKPQKIAVIIFIAFALGIIFLNPFKVGKPKLNKFTVTPNPQDTFNKAYDSKNPIFLEFYAPWWPTCKEGESVTLALENKYADKVNFIIANVDTPQGKEIARTFNVYTIPSYYFIGNKKIILHSEGKVERLALEEQIQYLIKQNK